MELKKNSYRAGVSNEVSDFLQQLGRGIDDMEAGRELPLEDAFQRIAELRNERRYAGI